MFKRKPDDIDPWPKDDPLKDIADKILPWMSQPVIIVVLFSVMFYLIISFYYFSYFKRLSVPFFILNLPITFYQDAGRIILTALFNIAQFTIPIFVIIIVISIIKLKYIPIYFKVLSCLICIVYNFIFCYTTFLKFPIMQLSDLSITIGLIISVISLYIIYMTIKKTYPTWDTARYIIFITMLVLIYLGIVSNIDIMAKNVANELLLGDNGFEVKLILDDNNSSLYNKSLMLIAQCNGNYYLTEKYDSLPEKVKSYVIPEKRVKEMIIIANDEPNRSSYLVSEFKSPIFDAYRWLQSKYKYSANLTSSRFFLYDIYT